MSWYQSSTLTVAESPATERAAFLRKTYGLVALAIAAFVGLEAILLSLPGVEALVQKFFFASRIGWFGVMVVFMAGSYAAQYMAANPSSTGLQYAGLSLMVVLQSLIFLPLLFIASKYFGFEVIAKAAIITGVVFGGLTATVLLTGRDFSFLGGAVAVMSFGALAIMVVSMFMGGGLGIWFAFLMVAIMSAAILYQTSVIQTQYPTTMYVAAAVALFASIMTLFWYVLQIVMSSSRSQN